MSMQALNQLVARSIVDPGIVQAFSAGRLQDILADLDFSPEMRASLVDLRASTWAEFAIMAYRLVKATAQPEARIDLPSPAEGLITSEAKANKRQVA